MYGAYRAAGNQDGKWSDDRPGNRCILAERRRHFERLIATSPADCRVLEIGCGAGGVLRELEGLISHGGGPSTLVGVDLLGDRLRLAAHSGHTVAQADGRELPFENEVLDLVVMATVFSSILDHGIRAAVAAEVTRVLKPGGALLWYDMRLPGPNRNVQPLGRRAIRALFPEMTVELESVTVLPPLVRLLGRFDRSVYPVLARVPAMRSHLIGLIQKPPTLGRR